MTGRAQEARLPRFNLRGSVARMFKNLAALAFLLAASATQAQDPAHIHGSAQIEQVTRLSVSQTGDWLTLDYGPIALPANTSHHELSQPQTLAIQLPVDGWISGFTVDLVDSTGHILPRRLLHHVNVIAAKQRELFSDIMLRVAAAGPETSPLSFPKIVGYQVHPGDSLIVSAMMENETSTPYVATIRVKMPFKGANSRVGAVGVFPFYLDVMPPTQAHSFDLPPGKSETFWEGTPAIGGRILGVGGHMHRYGTLLRLEDRTEKKVMWEGKPVIDSTGEVVAFPVARFVKRLGLPGLAMRADHVYRLTAFYDNPTGKVIPDGGMGALGGVFMPSRGTKWPAVDPQAAGYRSDVRGTFHLDPPR